MKLSFVVLILLFGCTRSSAAAPMVAPEPAGKMVDGAVTLTVDVDPVTAKVAMPIALSVTIDSPVGISLFPPTVGDSLGNLTVLSKTTSGPLPAEGNSDRRVQTYVFELESFTSGTTTIPSLEFRYQSPGMTTGPRKLISPPIEIAIVSDLTEDEDPMSARDFKDVVDPPSVLSTRLWPLCLSLVALAAIAMIVYRRRSSRLTPMRWAIEQIEAVRGSTAEELHHSVLLDRLAVTAKKFIGYQTNLDTSAMSSSELVATTRKIGWPDETIQTLQRFLREADGSKFASGLQSETSIMQWCDDLQRVVQSTSMNGKGAT